MKKHPSLVVLLSLQTLVLGWYTYWALKSQGPNLFAVFIANLRDLQWNGQFNLDFSCYLVLSGLWIAWRNKFSAGAVLCGTLAAVIGILFLAPYLMYLLAQEKGDLTRVLNGKR